LPDSDFCYFHDPLNREEQTEGRRKGGQSRSRKAAVLPSEVALDEPRTVDDAATILGRLTVWTLRGFVDAKITNAAVGCLNAYIGALKTCDLEARLEELERAARASKPISARLAGGGR
jgi:hypothetical protein